MDTVSQIKSRLPIEELVSQYVTLKKSGRHFKGLCPFHAEKTPSFIVSPEKQLAYCFGCHRGGDHFKFLEAMEGLDFPEALKFLAEKTGVQLPKRKPGAEKQKTQRDRLFEIHRQAVSYFSDQLWNTKDGQKVLAYLRKRGVTDETSRSFQLGFALDDFHAFSNFLLTKGCTKSELVMSGLVIAEEVSGEKIHDRFRGRLMIPISDIAGRVCAFSGRALKKDAEAKYLNSPETPIYEKRSTLFGLSLAKTDIKKKGNVVLVEGNMDVLACVQHGINNVVAISGTALTEEQLALLKRFTENLIFALDRDSAGEMAARRSFELSQTYGFSVRKVLWEDGKDPDEALRRDPKKFLAHVESAPLFLDALFSEVQKKFDLKTLEGKKSAFQELLPLLSTLGSALEKDEYIRKLATATSVDPRVIYDELKKEKKIFSPEQAQESPQRRTVSVQDYLLALLMSYPIYFSLAKNDILASDFISQEAKSLYTALENDYDNARLEDTSTFLKNLPPELQEKAKILALLSETTFLALPEDEVEEELKAAKENFIRDKFQREKRSLLNRLKESEDKGEKKELTKLFDSYTELLSRYGQKT